MKIVLTALILLGAALPAAAQMPPPPGEAMSAPGGRNRPPLHDPMHGMKRMYGSMSEAGRATMMAAMRSTDPRAGHIATQAARDRMLAVLDADRLDAAALKRAMDDERASANAAKTRQQAAMLGAYQTLSLADRRAFVADARAMRARIDERMAETKRDRTPDGTMPPPR